MRLVIKCRAVRARDELERAFEILHSAGIATNGGAIGPTDEGVLLIASDANGPIALRILRDRGFEARLE